MTKLGEMLSLYRAVNKIGTRELAMEIGVSSSTINRIEHGKQMDQTSLILVFCWLFNSEEKKETNILQ